ncbi:hypothetical protein CHIBA101_0896 [Actinomyces sp. Chiba101]|uniref:ABC-2 type transport system permease protein n=1 Tax=Actinomyces denticolens TaxID=52767 RepID=A0ABY1IKN6_9ACTO|nr:MULTISPECIES: hypothetical protein [Actinomyces]BAW92761.1 hypothetical protein CHIBA101_0896 [Actinomyces sp. Chiba101]GAV94271.1 hypothetical protein ADENT20671_1039 [Actinomyces denticolens]SHJ31173.1 ABC-2 type transport system permease protein [Actinomyces denticolens]SUU07214.1 lantibiotic protection ABC transporter permease subunit, MutE/EpiE family [Actinomyces denticolens]
MSAATTTAAPLAPASVPAGRAAFPEVLRAELIRSRRTFTWRSVLVTVLLAAWAINLARILLGAGLVSDSGRWAGNVLAWLSFYPTATALPVGALVGAMHEWREQRVRGGGTWWRAVPQAQVLAARCLVIAASALVGQLGWLLPVLTFAHLSGSGWGPARSYLTFAALMWVSVTGAGLLGLAAARLAGPVAVGLVPAGAFAWSVVGAVDAESSSWVVRPWTWMIRPTLPLLGVHGNSVNLEPGAAAWDYPVWPAAALCALSTLVLAALVLATAPLVHPWALMGRLRARASGSSGHEKTVDQSPTRAVRPTRTVQAPARPRRLVALPAAAPGPRSALLALAGILPWRLWVALWPALAGFVAATRALYSSESALALLGLVGVPVAAAVVGITTWTSLRSAWRGVLMRVSPWRAVLASLAGGWAFLAIGLGTAWLVAAGGTRLFPTEPDRGAIAGPVYMALVIPWVAAALTALAYLVAQVSSVAAAIAAGMGGLLAGLVIAGNEVIASAPLIWLTAPWGWSYVASTHHPARWLLIVIMSALGALACTVIASLTARRAARAPE